MPKRHTVPGFELDWFFEDSYGNKETEILPARQEDWDLKDPIPKSEQSLLFLSLRQAFQLKHIAGWQPGFLIGVSEC